MSKLLIAFKTIRLKKHYFPSPTAIPAPDWRGSLPLGLCIFCCTGRATGKKPLALHTKTASRVATKTEVKKWALKITSQQLANGF